MGGRCRPSVTREKPEREGHGLNCDWGRGGGGTAGVKASKKCVPSHRVARGFIKTLGSFERHLRPRAGAFSRAPGWEPR